MGPPIRTENGRSFTEQHGSWLLKAKALGNLVTSPRYAHTRITYHRTWETGLEVAACRYFWPRFLLRQAKLPAFNYWLELVRHESS
jgi:hypothetical protein